MGLSWHLHMCVIHYTSFLFTFPVFNFSIESLFVNSSKSNDVLVPLRRIQISVCHFVFLQSQDWVLLLRFVGRSFLFRACIVTLSWWALGRTGSITQGHWGFVGHFREPGNSGEPGSFEEGLFWRFEGTGCQLLTPSLESCWRKPVGVASCPGQSAGMRKTGPVSGGTH